MTYNDNILLKKKQTTIATRFGLVHVQVKNLGSEENLFVPCKSLNIFKSYQKKLFKQMQVSIVSSIWLNDFSFSKPRF